MSTFSRVKGGVPVPADSLVTADQKTITGKGNVFDPLAAVAGAIAVVVDDTSIGGDGTTAAPLHTLADGTEVLADATTVGGNGTTGNALHVILPGLYDKVQVAVDGSSIVGDGTTGNPLAAVGGPSGAGVSDGVTLQGTGLLVNPYAIKAVQHDASITGNGTVGSP